MKIIAISDTHSLHGGIRLPDGDVLVHAGDFMNTGRSTFEIREFFAWFEAQPHRHKVVIAGNHDILFEGSPGVARDLVPRNVVYLEDSSAEIDGLLFYGSPVTPRFMNWAFNRNRGAQIERHWAQIPKNLDVLITHGPPAGVLDCSFQFGERLGCEDLRRHVERTLPRAHIFGHIHGGYGRQTLSVSGFDIQCANVAICNERYQPVNPPTVIEFT